MARRPPKRRSLRATLADRIGVSDVARSIHAHVGVGVPHTRSISNDLVAVREEVAPYHYKGGARTTAWYPLNTGVPSGTSLTRIRPPIQTLGGSGVIRNIPMYILSGGIYDSVLIDGTDELPYVRGVIVTGPVTITNSEIRGMVHLENSGSLTMSDTTVTAQYMSPYCDTSSQLDAAKLNGIANYVNIGTMSLTRVQVSHFGKGLMIGSNVTMVDSWVHSAVVGYCDGGGAATHMESAFVWPASNVNFSRCYLDAGYDYNGVLIGGNMATAAILLHGDPRTHSSSTYDANLMRGGNFAMYCANSNVTVTNNRFLRDVNLPYAAFYGPRTAWDAAAGGTWSGNTYEDGTTPAP